jgi:hypothetical protein
MVTQSVMNFLASPKGYGAGQRFWSDLWNDVLDGPGIVPSEWEQELGMGY